MCGSVPNDQGMRMAERNNRKERVGVVVSDKMDKSVVVKIERKFMHPVYGRIVRTSSRYIAHDEKREQSWRHCENYRDSPVVKDQEMAGWRDPGKSKIILL